ncbi:hypothetical protein ACH5RR_018747 [Cinchona calisaya]|uniref:Uncharacterized protein n=1 Tax=Cinchona calisaya TaxID=153742 RepID=A0ABD2ZNL3_9GENT
MSINVNARFFVTSEETLLPMLVCFKEFGDRVLHWMTLNQANIFAIGSYDNGLIPFGHCSLAFGQMCNQGNSSTEPYIAGHNLLAHSSAVKLYSKSIRFPYPLVFGDYPDIIKKNGGARILVLTLHESKLVKGSFAYRAESLSTFYIKDKPNSLKIDIRDIIADMAVSLMLIICFALFVVNHLVLHKNDVTSSGLYEILEYLKKVYANPPTVSMKMVSVCVGTKPNGKLNDTPRVKFLHAYIGTLLDALRRGEEEKRKMGGKRGNRKAKDIGEEGKRRNEGEAKDMGEAEKKRKIWRERRRSWEEREK